MQDKHTQIVPKLRFPEFHSSQEWQNTKLEDIAIFLKGKFLPKSALSVDGDYPCIHYGELITIYSEVITAIISRTDQNENTLFSNENDVLMPTSGETPDVLAKACCIKLDNVILGGDILVIRTDKQEIYGEFLSRYIRHMEQKVLQYVTGTTVYHLYANSLKMLPLLIPEMEEQKKIAYCLGSLDDLIVAERSKIESLLKHKQGLIQQLFPKLVETSPRLSLALYPIDIEFKEFAEVCTFQRGTSITKKEITNGNIPVIGGGIKPAYYHNTSNRVGETIAVASSGINAGFVSFWDSPVFLSDSFSVNPDKNHFLPKFVFYFLKNKQEYIYSKKKGSGIPHVYGKDLSKILIPVLPFEMQKKIVACLGSLDELIEVKNYKLKALQKHKHGLMQKLFPS